MEGMDWGTILGVVLAALVGLLGLGGAGLLAKRGMTKKELKEKQALRDREAADRRAVDDIARTALDEMAARYADEIAEEREVLEKAVRSASPEESVAAAVKRSTERRRR